MSRVPERKEAKMGRMLASMFVLMAFALPSAAQLTPPDEPQLLSSSLWCGADGVKTVGSTAYVAYPNGIAVLDIADPAQPLLLGRTGCLGWCYGIDVSGDYAYLAQWEDGMRIVDVSDPSAPEEVGCYDTMGEVMQLVVRGRYAYLACSHWEGLQIVDVNDPAAPVLVGSCNTSGSCERIALAGDYAYVADGHEGVAVIDVSIPRLPHLVARWRVGFISSVQVADDLAYCVWVSGEGPRSDPSGILIYDVSDPLNPVYVGGYNSPEWVRGTHVAGDRCYIPSDQAILILDVSDPAAPLLFGRLPTGADPSCIDVHEDLAAIADGWGGFRTADVSDPEDPVILGTYWEAGATADVAFGERIAYVADGTFGLHIMDVRDPIHPAVLSRLPLVGGARAVAASEPHVLTMSSSGGIDVVDAGDPETPIHVAHLDLELDLRDVALAGSRAYAVSSHRFTSIDLADPEHPAILGGCPLPDWAWNVSVLGDFAYVGNGYAGLLVIDVSNPSLPAVCGSLDIYEWVFDLATDGTYVYANLDSNRLGVFDVSDPDHPVQIVNLQMPGFLYDMELVGDRLFCAAEPGVLVLDVSNPAAPVTIGTTRSHGTAIEVRGPFVGLAGGGPFEILGPAAASVAGVATAGKGIEITFANPIRGGTAFIDVRLDATQPVRVAIFDVLGRRIATVCDRVLSTGATRLAWEKRSVPAGMYYIRADGTARFATRSALILE
jgi:hypothetical protein